MREAIFDANWHRRQMEDHLERGDKWLKDAEDTISSSLYYRASSLNRSREAFEQAQVHFEGLLCALSKAAHKTRTLESALKLAGVSTKFRQYGDKL